MVEPTNKKRRLEANGSLDKQASFSDILQQLEAEADGSEGQQPSLIAKRSGSSPILIVQNLSRHQQHGHGQVYPNSTSRLTRSVSFFGHFFETRS